MEMSNKKPCQQITTSQNWYVIGLYHDSKIQIYDKYQTYDIYKFMALGSNWEIAPT